MTDWWKLLILIGVLGISYGAHVYFEKKAVGSAIVVTTTSIEKQYQDKLIIANQKAADAEASLAKFKVQADTDKQNAVKDINNQLVDALSQLQQRPTRADLTSSVASAVARAKSSCTGSGLYRDDAEFLTRYSALAAKSVIDRDYYYGQYENARRTLAGEKPLSGLNGQTNDAKPVSGTRVQH